MYILMSFEKSIYLHMYIFTTNISVTFKIAVPHSSELPPPPPPHIFQGTTDLLSVTKDIDLSLLGFNLNGIINM